MPRALWFRNEKGACEGRRIFARSYPLLLVFLFATRRRTMRPATPAPNSNTMGGAGTSVPPVEPPTPPDDEELEDEDVDVEVLEWAPDEVGPDEAMPPEVDEVLVTKPEEPPDDELDDELDDEELDDEEEPELVTAPLDVLTLPDDVDTPPVDVLIPPVEVLTPPVDVLTPPVDVETPPDVLDVLEPPEPPDEVELLMPPVLLEVDEITTVPPPPPPANPPKNPPPKPPAKPPDPPITTGAPLLPPPPSYGADGKYGAGKGGKACPAIVTTVGTHVEVVVVRTTLRTRFTLRTGDLCEIVRALCVFFATFCTTAGFESATCTAPPPINAPPQVHAHNFAKAMRTDINLPFFRNRLQVT